jgi:SAM-dependent methyltransferase
VPVEVLKSKEDIQRARARLEERGLSCLGLEVGGPPRLWQRLRGHRPLRLGDAVKSWDVLRTAEFLERSFPKTAQVLDIGAYSSEILPVLHRLGFSRLTGIDLNPEIGKMPYAGSIRYQTGNFLRTPFADHSFDVVTAISVIEHGFDGPALLREMSRLLAPGGTFVASFDYWPDKIDTDGTRFFGLDWLIFSRPEIESFLQKAKAHGLESDGAVALDAGERTIHCADRDYTFGWMALKKR